MADSSVKQQTHDENTIVHWDDEAILTAAGTKPAAVKKLLTRHDQPLPSDDAVYQWASRRWLPNEFRAILSYCLLADGKIQPSELFRLGTNRRKATSAK